VVALGGGHGLAASLIALRRLSDDITAVVTVADDGGSSGRLRAQMPDLLPPGDLRMALAALAGDGPESDVWGRLLQERFPEVPGPDGVDVGGHAVGNLLLAGLTRVLGDPVAALDRVAALVGAVGRVLPMALEPVTIEATVDGSAPARRVRGQVAVASAPGRVRRVTLDPPEPRSCPEVLAALAAADAVVLGPGSLFTSVLPHLLVPRLRDAVLRPDLTRVLVLNLVAQEGETDGFSPARHVRELARCVPGLRLDAVVADDAAVPVGGPDARALAAAAAAVGASVVLCPVAARTGGVALPVHDAGGLAAALRPLLGSRPRSAGPARALAGGAR